MATETLSEIQLEHAEGGMPQLDVATYPNMIFWLIVALVALYFILTRFALPGYLAYAAMKGGVEVMTRYLAKELGARGITVNTIAPGAIETDFGGGAVRDNPQLNAFVAAQTALGRAGQPEDIGGAIASLLSADSGWINAQRVEASGGMFV